ncbi:MAG: hypothetical protein WBD00_01470 [Candidatus Omnitrophota bacterium]|jgi:hypothetical protein
MRALRALLALLFLTNVVCAQAFSREIKVYMKIRGNTGLEEKVKEVIANEFSSFKDVAVTENREESHLYLDLSLVEQDPIRFYGLGVCIAYHVRDDFYSRPTSDVAQFGEDRMEDVCRYLAAQIDRSFVEPLRQPVE